MKAIIYKQPCAIDDADALSEVQVKDPSPGARDLLVTVEAISVNPVDTKLRANVAPSGEGILGWDAVGTVVSVGEAVERFEAGQRVWYAGALDRPGAYSELQCVDERLVATAPRTLSAAEAAALPLTSITAWELLFERLKIPLGKAPSDNVLLVSGAAGGVGSILLQLAARLTSTTIVATAGRPQSRKWVTSMGAHHVVDYHQPLAPQLEDAGLPAVTHIASLTHTDRYLEQFTDLLAPFGHLALIDDPPALDIVPLKRRSLSVHWELMFTRSLYQTKDMQAQGDLLAEVADLVDHGVLKTTMTNNLGKINVANLRRAHELIEQGGSRGKIVLAGFEA